MNFINNNDHLLRGEVHHSVFAEEVRIIKNAVRDNDVEVFNLIFRNSSCKDCWLDTVS